MAHPDRIIGTRVFGGYTITRKIGEGGMGIVYVAENRDLDKKLAIKVLLPERSTNRNATARFLAEARAASAIHHRNIIDIIDSSTLPDGRHYILMEYLDGTTLRRYARGIGPMPVDVVLAIMGQICSALQAAHDRGIVHRDLKPSNIFLAPQPDNPYFAKILDFGIAKLDDPALAGDIHTKSHTVAGTPNYMSPEQARALRDVDHRADIYSVGVIIYELLTGRLPYKAASIGDLTYKQASTRPSTVSDHRPEIPPAWNDLVMRAIAGTWQVDSGELFPLQFSGIDNIDFLEFSPAVDGARSGNGQLFASSTEGLVACTSLVYSELGVDAVTLSIPQLGAPDVRVLQHVSEDRIVLTDAFGNETALVRADAVPTESQCVEATIVEETALPVSIESFSGLVNDGSLLWYEARDNTWVPYNPTSKTFEPALPVPTGAGQFTHIHAFQAGNFWTHCGCGGSQDANLIEPTMGTIIDQVDTVALGAEIGIRGIAFDGINLILAGSDFDAGGIKIVVVDLNNDTVLSELNPRFSSTVLGLRGAEIWTLVNAFGRNIVRFNPADGTVLESLKLPDDIFISAFTFFGDSVFAIGSRGGDSFLLELAIPQ